MHSSSSDCHNTHAPCTYNRLRDAEGGSSFTVLDGGGGKGGDEYDPGFSEMQV